MAEELARAASSDQMLRNLKLTGLSTLQEGCVEIYRRRKRLQEALVLQCLFYTQYVAKATQALTPKTERPRFTIGLLGCGLVGRSLVDMLLDRGYPAEDIVVSTRSPQTLNSYSSLGIKCVHDNALVASQSRLLFMTVLPAQVPTVVASVRGHVRRRCLVVSTVLGLDERKLMQLLQTNVVVCARTHADFARMEPNQVLEKMDAYRVALLAEATREREVPMDGSDSSDSELGDPYAHRVPKDAAVSPEAAARHKAVDTLVADDGSGGAAAAAAAAGANTPPATLGALTKQRAAGAAAAGAGGGGGAMSEADIIADAVKQESLSSRAQRLQEATAETKDKVEKAWADAYEEDRKKAERRERSHKLHVEQLMRTQYSPPEEPGQAETSIVSRIAGLHLCRQEEQLRLIFVVLAYFAMKCGIPRDFAQLLACQELLGTDVGDMSFVTERAREKVARRHRRSSGIGPVIHRGPTDDVPTMEFPLAGFIIEAKLPVFWRQFQQCTLTARVLQAVQPPLEVGVGAGGGGAGAGERRRSSTLSGAGPGARVRSAGRARRPAGGGGDDGAGGAS